MKIQSSLFPVQSPVSGEFASVISLLIVGFEQSTMAQNGIKMHALWLDIP